MREHPKGKKIKRHLAPPERKHNVHIRLPQNVLEHLHDPEQVMAELFSSLHALPGFFDEVDPNSPQALATPVDRLVEEYFAKLDYAVRCPKREIVARALAASIIVSSYSLARYDEGKSRVERVRGTQRSGDVACTHAEAAVSKNNERFAQSFFESILQAGETVSPMNPLTAGWFLDEMYQGMTYDVNNRKMPAAAYDKFLHLLTVQHNFLIEFLADAYSAQRKADAQTPIWMPYREYLSNIILTHPSTLLATVDGLDILGGSKFKLSEFNEGWAKIAKGALAKLLKILDAYDFSEAGKEGEPENLDLPTVYFDTSSPFHEEIVERVRKTVIGFRAPHFYPLLFMLFNAYARQQPTARRHYDGRYFFRVIVGMFFDKVMGPLGDVLTIEQMQLIKKDLEAHWEKLVNADIRLFIEREDVLDNTHSIATYFVFRSVRAPNHPRFDIARYVEQAQAEQNVFNFPELTTEQREALEALSGQLKSDVLAHASMGVKQGQIELSDTVVLTIRPGEQEAPSAHIDFFDFHHLYQININQAGVAGVTDRDLNTPGNITDTDRILTTVAYAVLHDMVVRKLTIATETNTEQTPSVAPVGQEDTRVPPSETGSRIHVLDNYVIIEPETEPDDVDRGVRVQEQPSGELTVERFVRPHWVEVAVPVVQKARQRAFDALIASTPLTDERRDLLRRALLSERAHLTPVSELIQKLFRGDFFDAQACATFAEAFEQRERDEYTALLQRYVGQDIIDTAVQDGSYGRMNDTEREKLERDAQQTGRMRAQADGIHFSLPNAVGISQRRKADEAARQTAREQAQAAGRVYEESYQLPPARLRETQTFRSAHVREVAAVRLHNGIGRTPMGATIIKAGSALEATWRLAGVSFDKTSISQQ